jgi:hypothetical protein
MLILLTLFYGWSCDRVSCIDGKSRLKLSLLYEAICLPLNPGECGSRECAPAEHSRERYRRCYQEINVHRRYHDREGAGWTTERERPKKRIVAASQEGDAAVTVSLTKVSAGRDVHVQISTAVQNEQLRRNRGQMLEKVRLIWVKGLLEPSLSHLTRIELGLETQPDAVERPFDLLVQRPKQPPHPLPIGTPISRIFNEVGKALLILGEPGAGKTTLLLELTRDLLDQAKQDESHLIPVVFHLSSWVEQRLALRDWLVDELNKRYDVPRKLAQTWVKADVILPLLDGLDEVATDRREACVTAINGFVHEHGLLPLVVCSRTTDYEVLSVHLRLPNAVIIQPLSRQQVQNYVEQAGTSLAGLHTALYDDEAGRVLDLDFHPDMWHADSLIWREMPWS